MILGMCGLAGSGKDTAAKFVIADHGFVPMAFADEMKRICKRVYDFTDEQLWGPSEFRNLPDKRYPRQGHTWTKLPPRERQIHEEEKVKWPEAQVFVERDWYGCACCGLEAQSKVVYADDHDEQRQIEDVGPCYLTTRYALQQLGTGWGRDCYGDTWVMVTLRDARLLLGMDKSREVSGYWYDQKRGLLSNFKTNHIPDFIPGVILTDVRYLNEIRAVQAAGGKVVRVVRPGAGLQGGAALHSSETEQAALPDSVFDAVIANDESLEALQSRVHNLTANILGVR
jgi:hypothetical protein